MRQILRGVERLAAQGQPGSLRAMLGKFIETRKVQGSAAMTIKNHAWNILRFVEFCGERSVLVPTDVTPEWVERYQRHVMSLCRQDNGQPLMFNTRAQRLISLREFFRYLTKKGFVLHNPTFAMELPKEGRPLPRNVLTEDEVERILAQPDLSTPYGVRDRTILELLYSTAIRRMELAGLKLAQLDLHDRTLFVIEGKGKKDRVVPFGEHALVWLRKYLEDVRPVLVQSPDEGFVFLSRLGKRMADVTLTDTIRDYRKAAGVHKRGAAHMFRHTAATHMLENGADVRYVQQMLGHESLKTTQVYTHVSIRKLQEVHERTHPAKGDT